MVFALLFIGLMPIMFFSDIFSDGDLAADSDDTVEDDPASEPSGDGDFFDTLFDDPSEADPGNDGTGTGEDPLAPITGDDTPGAGDEINPDEVLPPDTGDDTPGAGGEINPDEVLPPDTGDDTPGAGDETDPNEVLVPDTSDGLPATGPEIDPDAVLHPADDYPVTGDGSFLQQTLATQTDFDAGSGWLGDRIGETCDLALGAGNDAFTAEDVGVDGTGTGALSDFDGTPVLAAESPVGVIDGGTGDDEITLGDAAAYAFGGAGDDTLTAGEGAAALFGGAGNDTLTGSDFASGAWLDGGDGDDVLNGGLADEVLYGGAHRGGDDTQQDDDRIDGGSGDDRIAGGYGADTLLGGDGDDVIDHLGRVEEEMSREQRDFAWHIDNDADSLDGGAGNDTLILDRADSATGGDGNDTFWVYFDSGTGAGAADVSDFAVGEDFLRVSLNPELDHGAMVVAVQPSDDGQDGVVSVNGEPIAILRGAPGATTADVRVEVVENLYA